MRSILVSSSFILPSDNGELKLTVPNLVLESSDLNKKRDTLNKIHMCQTRNHGQDDNTDEKVSMRLPYETLHSMPQDGSFLGCDLKLRSSRRVSTKGDYQFSIFNSFEGN